MMSSLKKNLSASASGWRRPNGPTRLGPGRSWISPAPRRSTQDNRPAAPRSAKAGIRTRRTRISQSAALTSDRPDGDERPLLHQDPAGELVLGHVAVSLDLGLDLPPQIERRPVAVAPAQSDRDQKEELPRRARG